MNQISFIFGWMLLLANCTAPSLASRHDWSVLQPYVLSVSPEDRNLPAAQKNLQLKFSHPILAESLSQVAVFLISSADAEQYGDDWRGMVDDIEDDDVMTVSATLTLADDLQTVSVAWDEDLSPQTDYVLMATPKLLSQDHVPLNQIWGGGEAAFFATHFLTAASELAEAEADVPQEAEPEAETDSDPTQEQSAETGEGPSASEVAEAEPETDAGASPSPAEATDGEFPGVDFMIQSVVLTEIVTDPQQDFNDSLGGDQIVFDSVIGTGTVGSTDEYIELYNGSAQSVDLSGWSVSLQDGTDVTQFLSIETWSESYFSEEGSFTDFESGEFAVLGNPDGQMNNAITVTLFDETGQTVDSLIVEDANANGLVDESYALDRDTGIWSQTTASPGY